MARLERVKSCLHGNLLTILTIAGVLSGVALGFILKGSKERWTLREISYVRFFGEIFLNCLKGLILPLIVSSMVAAVGSLELGLSKKIGKRGFALFMLTTIIAIVLGVTLAVIIRPGIHTEKGKQREHETEPGTVQDTLLDLVRNMFPPNLVQAALQHYKTKLTLPPGVSPNSTLRWEEYLIREEWEDGTNFLGLILFSIALGITLAKSGPTGKPLLLVFQCMADAMMILTSWVIWMSPIGVMFLITSEMLRVEDFGVVIKSLGLYFLTFVIGLAVHGLIILPTIFTIMTRKCPFLYTANMMPALLMAFGCGSSTATLPVTMKCVEKSNGVDPRVARFLLPIGATVNMDGTALFQAVAVIFIAQLVGIPLHIGKIITICVMAIASSIAAAGIPHGGFVTMVMLVNTIGLPAEYLAYIIPIDWLIDRLRTPVNVFSDSIVAGIVNHACRDDLEKLPPVRTDDDRHLLADELRCSGCNA